MTVLILGLVIW